MTYGSVCSGIGGIDLGFDWAGMECVWQCEIDTFCRRVLAKQWPGIHCYDGIDKIDETAPAIDVLCGGFPCQPHSVAGKRKGESDERNLWPECIRLVRLLRPRWCMFENVPGLLTTMFGQVCDDLRGAGYEIWPLVLGADDVGAPHRRKRVWIVANDKGQRQRSRSGKQRQNDRSGIVMAGAESRSNANNCSTGLAIPGHERLEGTGQCNSRTFATTQASEGMADSPRHDGADGRRKAGSGRRVRQASEAVVHAESTESERSNSGKAWLLRWPARPGEQQHDWEHPRLISNPNPRPGHGQRNERNESDQRSDGNTGAEAELCGAIEPGVGGTAHGLSRRLARLRREQLKALGNAVVPLDAYLIGKAMMEAEHENT